MYESTKCQETYVCWQFRFLLLYQSAEDMAKDMGITTYLLTLYLYTDILR